MKVRVLSLIILCLAISTTAFSQNQNSSAVTYLEDLHSQGLERVIVRFKAAIDTNLIDKYNGKIILTLQIINALACEIPQANIELLREEENIESISIDAVMKLQPEEM